MSDIFNNIKSTTSIINPSYKPVNITELNVKIKDDAGTIKYSVNNGTTWISITSWPTGFKTSNSQITDTNRLIIEFDTDLNLTSNLQFFYFTHTNTTFDGKGHIVTLTNCNNYNGLFYNGLFNYTSGNYGFDNVTIKNIGICVKRTDENYSSFLSSGGGYVCQEGFGYNAINNLIENCFSTGPIDGDNSGGIAGAHIAYENGNVTIRNCYSIGVQDSYSRGKGGIVGSSAGNNNGTVTITDCFNGTPNQVNINETGYFGYICGKYCENVIVSNCHFNGPINRVTPYGSLSNITNCYAYNGNWQDSVANGILQNLSVWKSIKPNLPYLLSNFNKTNYDKYNFPVPWISSISPQSCSLKGGQTITMYGQNFYNVEKIIYGNNLEIKTGITVSSNDNHGLYSKLTFTAPPYSGGQTFFQVKNQFNSDTDKVVYKIDTIDFIYADGPNITSVTPLTVTTDGGQTITLEGSGFEGVDNRFGLEFRRNGASETDEYSHLYCELNSSGTITFQVPRYDALDSIDLKLTTISGTTVYPNAYTYIPGQPLISSILTNTGQNYCSTIGGDEIIITGRGFFNVTSVVINNTSFRIDTTNTTPQTNNTFILNSSTQITLKIPPAGTNNEVSVTIVTDVNTVTNNTLFNYTRSPTLHTISPRYSYVGRPVYPVVFTGTNLFPPLEVIVNNTIADIAGLENYGVNSDGTQLVALIQDFVAVKGQATVKIRAAGGESITYNNLIGFYEPPEISDINPKTGGPNGGTRVTITGNYFYNLDKFIVKFNGSDATDIEFVNLTTIKVTTPSTISTGPAHIRVETSIDLVDYPGVFVYVDGPKITDIQPRLFPGRPKTLGSIGSFAVENLAFTSADIPLPAITKTGTGAITWSSNPPGIISINVQTNTFKTLRPGTVTLIATLADTNDYTSASNSTTFNIGKTNASLISNGFTDMEITYSPENTPIFITLPTVAIGTGQIVYTSTNESVASFDSSRASITTHKAGSIVITARLPETEIYNEVSKTIVVTINKASSTITPFALSTQTLTYNPDWQTISGLPVKSVGNGQFEYSSSDKTICDINGTTGTIRTIKAGTVTLTAVLTETEQYLGATQSVEIIVIKATGTLGVFPPIKSGIITYLPVPIPLARTELPEKTGNGQVTYSSSDINVLTVDKNTCAITTKKASPNLVTITATLASTDQYTGASVSTTVQVNKAQGSLTNFTTLGRRYFTPVSFIPENLPRVANTNGGFGSDGAITFSSSDTTVATINPTSGEITMGKTGTVTITATLAETDKYLGTSISSDLVILVSTSEITWTNIIRVYSSDPSELTKSEKATSIRGDGTITYSIADESIATIDATSGTITMKKAGKTTIYADLTGTNYTPKRESRQLVILNEQGTLSDFVFGSNISTPVTSINVQTCTMTYQLEIFMPQVPRTSNSDGVVRFSSDNERVATVNAETGAITFIKAGLVTITATLATTDKYLGTRKSIIINVTKAKGILTDFPSLGTRTYSNVYFIPTLPEIIESNGQIIYTSSAPNIVRVVNSTTGELVLVQPGTATITAFLQETDQYTSDSKTSNVEVGIADSSLSEFVIRNADDKVIYEPNLQIIPIQMPSVIVGTGRIEYTSNKPDIASVDIYTGQISILKVGPVGTSENTITITARLPATTRYSESVITAKFVIRKNQGEILPLASTLSSVTYSNVPYTPGDFANIVGRQRSDSPLIFTSSDNTVATINSNGQINIKKAGMITITVSLPETEKYLGASDKSTRITINKLTRSLDNWTNNVITWKPDQTERNFKGTAKPTIPTIHDNTEEFVITNSDNTVAIYNFTTNIFTMLNPGETTITATLPGNDRYNTVSISCVCRINKIVSVLSDFRNYLYPHDKSKIIDDLIWSSQSIFPRPYLTLPNIIIGPPDSKIRYTYSNMTIVPVLKDLLPGTSTELNVHVIKSGMMTITASIDGDNYYTSASTSCSFFVGKANPNVHWGGDQTFDYSGGLGYTNGGLSFHLGSLYHDGNGSESFSISDNWVGRIQGGNSVFIYHRDSSNPSSKVTITGYVSETDNYTAGYATKTLTINYNA